MGDELPQIVNANPIDVTELAIKSGGTELANNNSNNPVW